jgi:hypothetical protein
VTWLTAINIQVKHSSKGVVDAPIDLYVVAISTLDLFKVNAIRAWDGVHAANKEVGVKESRPNPLGLPDLIKPQGWVAPNHNGNHGLIDVALKGTGYIPSDE